MQLHSAPWINLLRLIFPRCARGLPAIKHRQIGKKKKNMVIYGGYCLDARIIISLPAFRAYEARAVRKSGGGVLKILRS